MRQTITGPSAPTAQLCVNKSRLKVYNKEKSPTYYLTNGQEFQIELFNPTSDSILAKIRLNGNLISQGGLVLRPGERVFLERYIDVAKKFLFETYEVSNTSAVRKAIEDNGDFKVEFFRETRPLPSYGTVTLTTFTYPFRNTDGDHYKNLNAQQNNINVGSGGYSGCGGGTGGVNAFYNNTTNISSSIGGPITTSNSSGTAFLRGDMSYASLDSFDSNSLHDKFEEPQLKNLGLASNKIETGRVEAGSTSDQKLEYVSKSFEFYAFHTVEYKMLPLSQKVNTIADINVAQYCTNCGAKQKAEYKFCPSCGARK